MATIKDVAAAAGVSVSTASRALNDNPRISTATVAKVKAAAAQLNYQPNRLARTLSTGEARMVGAIFPVTGETACIWNCSRVFASICSKTRTRWPNALLRSGVLTRPCCLLRWKMQIFISIRSV